MRMTEIMACYSDEVNPTIIDEQQSLTHLNINLAREARTAGLKHRRKKQEATLFDTVRSN